MKDRKTKISVSIPKNLLSHIETEISGKSRSEKIEKVVSIGYHILMVKAECEKCLTEIKNARTTPTT